MSHRAGFRTTPAGQSRVTARCCLVLLLFAAACAGCSDDPEAATTSDATTDAGSDAEQLDGVDDITPGATDTGATDTTAMDTGTQPGLPSPAFTDGCPKPGRALVRQLTTDLQRFEGPASVAAKGDWMLANEHVAFVIKAPTQTEHTYAYYGGLLVDAVALNGCSQAAPEQFGELIPLIGKIDITDITASVLRTFRGVKAEVLADGSDGKAAKLRVWGQDDFFWLVELALIKEAYLAEKPKLRSVPLGVQLALDYTLEPGRAVIQIELVAINTTNSAQELHVGLAAFVDDATAQQVWSGGTLSFGNFGLKTGLPWITGSAKAGAIVIAVDAANLATAHISGVDALVPIDQLADPLALAKQGAPGDSDLQRYWVGVGKGDSASAVASLEGISIGGATFSSVTVSGVVREEDTGTPIGGGTVVLERRRNQGDFATLLSTRTATDGSYSLRVPRLGAKGDLRLIARIPGRTAGAPVTVAEGAGPFTDVELRDGPPGLLGHDVRDGDGNPVPARLTLFDSDGAPTDLVYATGGVGSFPVPPGAYTLVVTRGYHYRPWSGAVIVAPNKSTLVKPILKRVVDTSGWMSFDGHVHAAPSPDSTVPLAERYRGAAAEGLDVVIHTEHEIIVNSEPAREASGVAKWVRGVAGQEVTATLPEHTNMVGVKPDPSHRRGAPVKWYGLDIDQIYAAEDARGAGFVALNHPRKGCNWLCVIGWDRLKIGATLTDPTAVGLPAGATLWSWNFDAVELLNGMDSGVFLDSAAPTKTGTFEDWMSFWNGGHRITALGVTDVHGDGPPGQPRTFFKVPKDDLAAFTDAWLIDAVKAGRTMVSAGAFARVTIDGKGPGELVTVTVSGAGGAVGSVVMKVRIEAIPEIDVTRVVVLVNCDTALDVPTTAPDGVVKLDTTLTVPLSQDSHIVVLAFGKKPMPKGLQGVNAAKVPRVVTNPIRVDVDGDGKWTPPGGKLCDVTPGG